MEYSLTDILALEKYFRISLINKIIGYKSANLIATKSNSGITNLAIFNSVVHIGANPPLLGFITRPLQVERHTYSNIKENGFFTINQVTSDIHQSAHLTSAKYLKEESEFEKCNLTEEYFNSFPIPFVKESKIKIGLSYQEEHQISANNTILIIGKIERIIIDESAVENDGDIHLEKLDTVAVGGLDTYYTGHKIARYDYARPNKNIVIIK